MATQITHGVKISVEPEYQDQHSCPYKKDYSFTYKIIIENNSGFTFRLLKGHWEIINAYTDKRQRKGAGGHQPLLEPNEIYSYYSGVHLTTSIGKMYGYFIMERDIDGKKFKVNIPPFTLFASFKAN